eukprot:gb/GEZN01002114.1/.p2 GENE.gb/GEZN01002114.1/~~gb/GEZN01002114.1/.p2  ORF type:complete len:336 (+),score=38.07 gb/GEZN01002114.1/:1154-2161(+)
MSDDPFARFLGTPNRNYVMNNKGAPTPIASLKGHVVALYFSAHWCGPCRMFTPNLIRVYNENKAAGKPFEVVFVSQDHDLSKFNTYFSSMPWLAIPFEETQLRQQLMQAFGVRGIPTVVLLDENGKLITTDGRSAVIKQKFPFKASADESKQGEGIVAAGGEASWMKGQQDVTSLLVKEKTSFLNDSTAHPGINVFKEGAAYCESASDEQLLFSLTFQAPIKLHSIGLQSLSDSRKPSIVKVWINKPTMDFADVEDSEPLQAWGLSKEWNEVKDDPVYKGQSRALLSTKFVKFQKVTNLTLFIEGNTGEENTTVVSRLRFFGVPSAGLDMQKWGT